MERFVPRQSVFNTPLGKNVEIFKSKAAENPGLGTGTSVLELQSAETSAISFTTGVWKASCLLVLKGGEGEKQLDIKYVLAKSCLKLNYTLVITSIARQKY